MNKMKDLFQKLVYIKTKQCEADKERLWDYYEPEAPADIKEIRMLENKLKIKLSDEYINFLLCANGWKCFYQDVDLFGIFDFNKEIAAYAKQLLDTEMLYSSKLKTKKNNLLPIAVSKSDIDLFVLVLAQDENYGEVIWLAGGEIEYFSSFYKFFEGMIGYNENELEEIIRDNLK